MSDVLSSKSHQQEGGETPAGSGCQTSWGHGCSETERQKECTPEKRRRNSSGMTVTLRPIRSQHGWLVRSHSHSFLRSLRWLIQPSNPFDYALQARRRQLASFMSLPQNGLLILVVSVFAFLAVAAAAPEPMQCNFVDPSFTGATHGDRQS